MKKRSQVKVGVRKGAGLPPGYRWWVDYLTVAESEARSFLTHEQIEHLVEQFRELASERDPTHPQTVSVDAVEDFFELRDKGGPLGKINVRVFFFLHKKSIVVLGAIKKENEGKTPRATVHVMSDRLRRYVLGEYGGPERKE